VGTPEIEFQIMHWGASNYLASALHGLHSESAPDNSTGSNSEDDVECPSVSPVVPVSDVPLIRPKTDMASE